MFKEDIQHKSGAHIFEILSGEEQGWFKCSHAGNPIQRRQCKPG